MKALEAVETKRLLIRRFEPGDRQALHAYTSDPQVMTYIPEGLFTEEDARRFIEENSGDNPSAYAVLRKHGGDLIGHISFHPWFAERTYEIGWVFNRAHHGQGYATEAAEVFLRHGFEVMNLHRIIATCQPENPASYRVMEKLGMRREGHFRKCIYRGDGVWWDEYFYAILQEEWTG